MGQLGTMLTRAREARGLTIEDAERDTRISKRYLAALEAEEFEVIPAPVYARGFLRSYSQYLGLEPGSVLALFPRDESSPPQQQPQRPSNQTPVSALGASRPAWKRPAQPAPAPQQPAPRPLSRRAPPRHEADPDWEPTIGVDIGVPAPARRLQRDPAAQTRTAVVAIVAIGAILGVLLLAFLISSFAGDGEDQGVLPGGSETEETPEPTNTTQAASGEVPSVVGMSEDAARIEIQAAGFTMTALRETRSEPEGQVVDQSPAPGEVRDRGEVVTVIVSDGPG